MFIRNSMIIFPLYITFLDLIKLKLCGKGRKFSVSQLLMCVCSLLLSALDKPLIKGCLYISSLGSQSNYLQKMTTI